MNVQKIKLTESQIQELTQHKTNVECTKNEYKRIQAILLLDRGIQTQLIEEATDYDKKYVFEIRKKYLKRGLKGLLDKKKKQAALLTRGQRAEIAKILNTVTPRVFGFECDYWTTAILAMLIEEQYNVKYKSKTAIHLIFKEAKFTYHKPDTQYKKRDQKLIDEWKDKYEPIIKKALSDEDTVVLVEDEMMLTTQTTTQKIWLPKGEFPKIDVSSKRQLRTVYGFLNIKTGQQNAFKALRANSEETIVALEKIGEAYKGKKIVLIWDNASWHGSEQIKEFLRTTKYSFHLIKLPPYAADLNPQEHVWKAGRAKVTHNTFIDDIDKATDDFIAYLNESIFDYKFV